MIQVDPVIYIWLASLLLFLPFDWVVSAFTAALFHELCHIAVLIILGGKINRIRVTVSGCVIESSSAGFSSMLCSILAGPVGSIALVLFCRGMPKLAVCGLFHGVYNLLPFSSLDGGHILFLIFSRICPKNAEIIVLWIGRCVYAFIFAGIAWFLTAVKIPVSLAIIYILGCIRLFPRKIPCKQPQIKVQ